MSDSARKFHEGSWVDVLARLRNGGLTRQTWERENPASRIAPAIDMLRNGFGYVIEGDGRFETPYVMLDPSQVPTMVPVSEEIKNAYYLTPHWRSIRNTRLTFDSFMCVRCHEKSVLQVHHWRYDLFHEENNDLMTLCETCHEFIHDHCRMGWPKGILIEHMHMLGIEISQENQKLLVGLL